LAKLDWNKAKQRQPDPAAVNVPPSFNLPYKPLTREQIEEEERKRIALERAAQEGAIAYRERESTIEWEARVRGQAKRLRRAELKGHQITNSELDLVQKWLEARKKLYGKQG
jgi:hypothetical protein